MLKIISLSCISILLVSLLFACQSSPHLHISLDQRLSKYKPRWVPNFLREYYPENENYPVLWGGDMTVDNFSCRVGLYDKNGNGRFDDKGIDMVLIAPYGQQEVMIHPQATAAYLKENFTLNLNNQCFRLTAVDSAGRWVELWKLDQRSYPADVQFMEILPDIPLQSLQGDSTSFHQYLETDKLLYVEVWSSWHQYSFESTPYLKHTLEKYAERLNALTLIYNEVEIERVHRNNATHMVNWPQAMYSEEAGTALLHLGWVPYGVLYSGDGRMIKSGIRPQELDRFLEEYL